MWSGTVGLVNGQHKYLTAETFGFKINANGIGLKKKQLWTLEPFPLTSSQNGNNVSSANYEELSELENVAIKSHLNCYLAVDNFGNVTCEQKERTEGARFTINICCMSNAQGAETIYWAFRNVQRGYYLGATSEGMISCNMKMPKSRTELWHIHLIPARGATMFALKSIGRKRYARVLAEEQQCNGSKGEESGNEQIQVDATSPWGSETLFQFKYYEGGKYALLTSSCKYVTCDGNCISIKPPQKNGSISPALPPPSCLFTIEYHGGHVAFRDYNGRYLAGTGRASILRSRSNNVSKDEMFLFENAPIQISLRATFNNKWVSVKQGIDLSANQNEPTMQHETFQLQYDNSTEMWHVSTYEGNYWALGAASTIQASSKDEKNCGHFRLKWNGDGTCSILLSDKANAKEEEMKWICNRKSGQLCSGTSEPVKFYMRFRNRTALNLRASTGSGFVGLKQAGSGKLESNKTSPDSIIIEYTNSENNEDESSFNCYYLKMPANNKYWSVIETNLVACDATSSTCAQQWTIELRNGSCIAIRTFENDSYLTLTNQGAITVSNCLPKDATLWEF